MTEEEKEAVKYTENCLMKITMGIDCEFDVNILDALINIIKKLQKENEELKNQEATARRINELLVQRYSNSIPVQKVEDKIKELDERIKNPERNSYWASYTVSECIGIRRILQDLLERTG